MAVTLGMFLPNGGAQAAEEVPVNCPALSYEDGSQFMMNAAPRFFGPSLIALGKTKALDGGVDGGRAKLRLEIEEVLYGDRSIKTADFSDFGSKELRAIYFLHPTGSLAKPEYGQAYTMDAKDLPAARALAAARFDTLVLNASSIIIGEDTNDERQDGRTRRVKVMANLAGEKLTENDVITVDRTPHAFSGPQLYVLQRDRFRPAGAKPVYTWSATLPLKSKDEVLASLGKRESYPMVDNLENRDRPRFREIVFQGSTEQALAFLASENAAAQVLAQRFFFHHRGEARALLAPRIEGALLETGVAKWDEFELQRRTIQTLALVEKKEPTGAIAALMEKLIGQLEAAPAPVAIPERPNRRTAFRGSYGRSPGEEETVDVNHSLAWLLQQMPEDESARRWGERLLALKARLTGWWQQEAALAVDILRLESSRELAAALERMKKVTPVRSAVVHEDQPSRTEGIYFSADNRRLWSVAANGRVCLWDAGTMKMIERRMPPQGYELWSVANPKGDYALFTKGFPKDPLSLTKVAMIAPESGKTLLAMELPLWSYGAVYWLSGVQLLVANGQTLSVIDAVRGKTVRQAAYQGYDHPYYISMDRLFALGGPSRKGQAYINDRIDLTTGAITHVELKEDGDTVTLDGVTYEQLEQPDEPRTPKITPEIRGYEVREKFESPDHRRVAVVTGQRIPLDGRAAQDDPQSPKVIRIHDAESLRMVGAIETSTGFIMAKFNADGSQLAVVYHDGSIARWPLPP